MSRARAVAFGLTALALGGAFFPMPAARAPALLAFACVALGLGVWGTTSLRSGLFVRARCGGRADGGRVALTYDDGPDPRATPALLELLAARGVRATFFCVGERAAAHPELVRRLAAEGHQVENHSQRHSPWTNFYGRARMRAEIEACQRTLGALLGRPPRFYRPPMGLANHALAAAARDAGVEVVGWQARGLDTGVRPPERVVRRIVARLRPGGIALLHDGGVDPERVRAITARLLDELSARGLRPVLLSELLGED
ncbi:MAG: polysaccharide deacetylase family protein [Planctomycetota bacterium]|nr:MAG: polysaccharide deacetylase family protein [Planctomycetota bacterium]